MINRLLTTESPLFINPQDIIPISPEHIINAHASTLSYLLSNLFNEGADIDIFSTPDILDKKESPEAYDLAMSILEDSNSPGEQYSFAKRVSYQHKLIQRNILQENRRGRRRFKNSIVRPSNKSPLCFKWTLKLEGKQFAEIFLVPVLVRRSKRFSLQNKKSTVGYETLIIAVGQEKPKKPLPNDIIQICSIDDLEFPPIMHGTYKNDEDDGGLPYFGMVTDEPLSDEDVDNSLTDDFRKFVLSCF